MKRKLRSKLSLRQIMSSLKEVRYDMEELAYRTGIDVQTLAEVLADHGRDENYLAICAAADMQAMQKAHRLRDAALDELEDAVRSAEKTSHAIQAAKIILDYHTALAERVQLPALAARLEQTVNQRNFGFGGTSD